MAKKVTDTIAQQKSKLALLNTESSRAIDVVTATINRLISVNEQIDATINEIQDKQNQLQDTKDGLAQTRDRNIKVVENFKALIEV